MYQNYIFDLYGTLVDIRTNEKKSYLWEKTAMVFSLQGAQYSKKELRKRCKELVAKQKEITEEFSLNKHSYEEREIQLFQVCKELYQEKGVEPSENQIMNIALFFRALSIEYLCLYKDADLLLKRLQNNGKKIYLLSNAQRMFTEPEMRLLGIYDKFHGILYSSDVGYQKPSPRFYQELFDTFSLKKEESVMIGNDHVADILGAHKFGINSIYIHTRQSPEFFGMLPNTCRRIEEISEVYADT